jgi:hypothetical protein
MSISDQELREMWDRLRAASPGPWRPMIEGRDHVAGDDFIMIGEGAERSDDMYVLRENRPADREDLDFIGHARQDMERLLGEVEHLRSGAPNGS